MFVRAMAIYLRADTIQEEQNTKGNHNVQPFSLEVYVTPTQTVSVHVFSHYQVRMITERNTSSQHSERMFVKEH